MAVREGRVRRATTACVVKPEVRREGRAGELSINDGRYKYRTIAGRTVGVVRVVRLRKEATGEEYDVTLLSNGRIDCTCADFTFRKSDKAQDRHRCEASDGLCKHGRALRLCGVFDDGAAATPPARENRPTAAEVAEELRAAEARDMADRGLMLANVGRHFGDHFRALVEAELMDDHGEAF
jgi:hypothetical protein